MVLNSPRITAVLGDNIEELDFAQNPEACLNYINNFVNDSTRGFIKKLFSPVDISSSTNIVVVNAAFFKATWSAKFDENLTKLKPFYGITTNYVPMMTQTGNFKYRKLVDEFLKFDHINSKTRRFFAFFREI